jgi:transcriptional regulator with XRE-family HTH domain
MSIRKKKSEALKFLENITGGPVTIGKLLEAIRLGEEMTQPEFAKKLGISKSHLNDIEKERKALSPARAARFAKILGYSRTRFVSLALQALVDQAGLKMRVEVA